MSSSSFLLLPNDPTKRFCYVNFQVGHMLADCPAMSFLLKCRQKLCLKNKTKNTITNQFRGVTKSIHKLTIWNIGNGAACLKELTRKGQDFCPGDDIIRVNKGRVHICYWWWFGTVLFANDEGDALVEMDCNTNWNIASQSPRYPSDILDLQTFSKFYSSSFSSPTLPF